MKETAAKANYMKASTSFPGLLNLKKGKSPGNEVVKGCQILAEITTQKKKRTTEISGKNVAIIGNSIVLAYARGIT